MSNSERIPKNMDQWLDRLINNATQREREVSEERNKKLCRGSFRRATARRKSRRVWSWIWIR